MVRNWIPELAAETLSGFFGEPALLRYEIQYPRILSRLPAAQRINNFCTMRASALERFACTSALAEAQRQKSMMGESFFLLEVTASFQIMRCGGGLLSGFADGCRQMGARGTRLTRLSRTFDLGTGHEIPLAGLFHPGSLWRSCVLAELEKEIAVREAAEPGSYYRNAADICRRRLSPHGYYLADDGLAIWYPQECIAPGNTGIPTFLIRYEYIKSMLQREL